MNHLIVEIRAATPRDRAAIRTLLDAAFDGSEESRLVDRLRDESLSTCELVATEQEQVVGHIMFSPLGVSAAGCEVCAAALAPLAVMPDRQRRGIGTLLVRRRLHLLEEGQTEAVIVLGHPDYYRRFGFSSDLAAGLQAPYQGEAFMALEFVPGVLSPVPAIVVYPEAFTRVE